MPTEGTIRSPRVVRSSHTATAADLVGAVAASSNNGGAAFFPRDDAGIIGEDDDDDGVGWRM